MEQQYKTSINGQAVLTTDLDRMGEASALADDRVFAELLQMTPYDGTNVARGVLASGALVAPNGNTGTVLVQPFRAFVGSTTAVATDAKKNHRDIRSAIAVGSTTLGQSVALAANASGFSRWDLIYAIVTPNAAAGSVTRKMKDPTSRLVSAVSIPSYLQTTVALAVAQGTPMATPEWPAMPAAPTGSYNIALAYCVVPTAWDSTQAMVTTDICIVAPCLALADDTGAAAVQPANTSTILSLAEQHAWAAGTRPTRYMPSTMVGGASLLIALDLTTGSPSHAVGAVLDSRDWRKRFYKSTISISVGTAKFAWTVGGVTADNVPDGIVEVFFPPSATGNYVAMAVGQTLKQDDATVAQTVVARANPGTIASMPAGSRIDVYVDHADGGKLKVYYTSAPNCRAFVWIDFSGPFSNAI